MNGPDARAGLRLPVLQILVVLPFLAAAVWGAAVEWYPSRDMALIEIRTWDVGSHSPMVGTYSRFKWNHPGPLMFWALAPAYRALGASPSGLVVGAALWNALAAATLVWLVRRRGGVAGAAVAALGILGFVAVAPDLFVSAWNPYLAALPFALVVVASWALACGDRLALPILIAAGSFTAQTHLSYLPVVAAACLWGVGWFVWRLRRSDARAGLVPVLLLSAGIATVLWVPVLWDQVAGSGNLGRVFDDMGRAYRQTLGLQALRLAPAVLTPWGLLRTSETFAPGAPALIAAVPPSLLLVPVAGLVAAGLLAWRRRRQAVLLLLGLMALLLAASVAALAAISGGPWVYLFVWLWVVGLALWTSVLCALLPIDAAVAEPMPRRALSGWTAAVLGVAALAAVARIAMLEPDNPVVSRGIGILTAAARRSLERGTSFTVEGRGGGMLGYEAGVAADLVRAGYRLIVDPKDGFIWGEHRTGDRASVPNQLIVAVGPEQIAAAAAQKNFERLATFDPAVDAADVGHDHGPDPVGRGSRARDPSRVPAALFLRRR
jgi:hypothetical protein